MGPTLVEINRMVRTAVSTMSYPTVAGTTLPSLPLDCLSIVQPFDSTVKFFLRSAKYRHSSRQNSTLLIFLEIRTGKFFVVPASIAMSS